MSAIVNADGLGIEAVLVRAESMLARRKLSKYRGEHRVVLSFQDYAMGMHDLRVALAMVLKAKGKDEEAERVRKIVM